MIHIERVDPPVEFAQNSQRWSDEFNRKRITNPELSASAFWNRVRQRARMKDYAHALCLVFSNKCGYCESWIHHVAPGNIDYYLPKSHPGFESYMFDWENWILSCPICNQNKGTYYELCDDVACLVNPFKDRPEDHLRFQKARVILVTIRGEKTGDRIKLNRSALVDTRTQWLLQIMALLALWVKLPDPEKNVIRDILLWSMQGDAPYSAMVRAFLSEHAPKFAHPRTPHDRVEIKDPTLALATILEKYSTELDQLD